MNIEVRLDQIEPSLSHTFSSSVKMLRLASYITPRNVVFLAHLLWNEQQLNAGWVQSMIDKYVYIILTVVALPLSVVICDCPSKNQPSLHLQFGHFNGS